MDLRFSHPANSLVCGGSGSGKTFFMKRVVENRDEIFDVVFDEVVWHYTEWQDIYNDLQLKHGVRFVEGPPLMEQFPSNQGPKLVIADDFMDQLKNPEFLKIVIKGSHHRSLSFFLLSQCIFPKNMREISLQSHYCVVMKTARDLSQIRTFCMQIDPKNWRALHEAYEDSCKEGHSYLLFDFHVRQKEHLRLRTHIFPGENTIIYVPKTKYKNEFLLLQ